jgi:hypothetical protein
MSNLNLNLLHYHNTLCYGIMQGKMVLALKLAAANRIAALFLDSLCLLCL